MSEAVEKNERFIVVGVDGSEPSLKALRWAAQQARLTGATLRVLTTWEVATGTGWVPTFPVDYDPQAVARQALDEAITETLGADPDVAVERIVKEGHAAPVLLAAAKDADLLVVGSHGHGAFAGMLIGSGSEPPRQWRSASGYRRLTPSPAQLSRRCSIARPSRLLTAGVCSGRCRSRSAQASTGRCWARTEQARPRSCACWVPSVILPPGRRSCSAPVSARATSRSAEHTSELPSLRHLVC